MLDNQAMINGMSTILRETNRHRLKGPCVLSDLLRDGAFAMAHTLEEPIYWILTEQATGIGYSKEYTIDYYQKETPAGCIAAYVWHDNVWTEIELDITS